MPSAGPVAPTAAAACRLRPLPLGAVRITGGPWAARQHVNRTVAIPAGRTDSGHVCQWLEALAWEYARQPAPDLLSAQREATAELLATRPPPTADLIHAAIAQVRATGDRDLLAVATDVTDDDPDAARALVELFRETDNRRFLDLAGKLVKHDTAQAAAGAADVATECDDRELLETLAARFAATALTADHAYPMVQWAWRMLLATGDPRYAHATDRLLHNGFAAGPARDTRRILSTMDNYLATADADGVQIQLHAPCVLTARLGDGRITLAVEIARTDVTVRVCETPAREWTLSLRVPPWATRAELTVAGGRPQPTRAGTYADVERAWRPGDELTLRAR
ncbi:glycoside hydrolase family 127 protein [Asanoa sp. WMMD1127]|uniref:beta-L-arabinofuranosidase domain-containing protein n=1 Tax=Asanoa sp. WMMD1127 TaxID=3016107 RepID=UPI00241711F1|nr:beta-L-arabinofuranosidase domain-containing protein [Asanoa sp. WMMD1127]MDG4825654.1 glycoside hydrolase family 127 protein [Asanoa sp. WMMD1127]